MVTHLLAGTIKGVMIAALAFPGINAVSEFILEGFDVNADAVDAVAEIQRLEPGAGKSVASLTQGVHDINEQFAALAAQVGNTIGVNRLAGIPTLNAANFTDNWGIIPATAGGIVEGGQDLLEAAVDPENRGAVAAGLVGGGALIAMSPRAAEEVRFTVQSAAKGFSDTASRAMQMTNTASHSAKETLGNFTEKLNNSRAAAAAAPAHHAKA